LLEGKNDETDPSTKTSLKWTRCWRCLVVVEIERRWDSGDGGKGRKRVGKRFDGLGTWRDAGWTTMRTGPRKIGRPDLEMDCCCLRSHSSQSCLVEMEEGRQRKRRRMVDC